MKKIYAFYLLATGKITQLGRVSENNFNNQANLLTAQQGMIELPEYSWDYWVDTSGETPVAVEKTDMPYTINKTTMLADGVDLISITGLPNPVNVVWPDGVETIETDGSVEFALTMAGDYTVTLSAVAHKKEVLDVTATN